MRQRMMALNHDTEMPVQQASGSGMSCTGKITVPKKPVARVSGAKMIVTTANRCMMMFMLLPCDAHQKTFEQSTSNGRHPLVLS